MGRLCWIIPQAQYNQNGPSKKEAGRFKVGDMTTETDIELMWT